MKNLRVTVNGKVYDVQVEETSSNQNSNATFSNNTESVVTEPAPAMPSSKPSDSSNNTGESIDSPMPGTILDIKVTNGQKVSKGETLLILEAMKMENEIVSPRDAVVNSIKVSKGQNVDSGTPLVFIS